MMFDPSGFSLAGCRCQTVGYGAASLHCHAGDSVEDKKRIELRAAPYFYILFLYFTIVVFFLSQKNCKTKGYMQKI